MLSLTSNICGKPFCDYLSVCFQHADVFSLTQNGWFDADKNEESDRLLQLLKPYHIHTLRTNHWFCYRVPAGYKIVIYLFKAIPETKDILLAEYNSIFYKDTLWRKPEDMCFFKKGKLICGSVSHERICYAYEQGNSFEDQIKLHGIWEQVPTDLIEQIQIPQLRSRKKNIRNKWDR